MAGGTRSKKNGSTRVTTTSVSLEQRRFLLELQTVRFPRERRWRLSEPLRTQCLKVSADNIRLRVSCGSGL